jgi:dynein heavy chain
LEGIDQILSVFNGRVKNFKALNHKLLAYNEDRFDRDFVEFNVYVSDVDTML